MVTEDPTSACVDCPLSAKYRGRGAMTVRLEHGGKVYGLLSLSIPRALIAGEEEQTLFQEVAKDIAFALHGMELEEERKRAEEALRESDEFSSSLLNSSPNATLVINADTSIRYVNPAFEKLTGFAPRELAGRKAPYPWWIDETPHMTREGRVVGFQGTHRDITERKKAEEALQESEARYRQLVGLSPDGIAIESGGQIAFINPAGVEILAGANPEQLIGRSVMDFVHPDYHGIVIERMRQVKEEGKVAPANEEKYIRLDGTVIDVEVSASPVVYESQPATQVFVHNITERKKAEERIEASLKEKEVLLKEIHHRVKNNLQVISSLLKLQSRRVGDERYAEMLNDSQNRLKSIALIHEKLYQSEDLGRIGFGGYIKSLVRGLFSAYRAEAGRIALRIEVEDIRLGVNYAMPCGLIVNELVSKA